MAGESDLNSGLFEQVNRLSIRSVVQVPGWKEIDPAEMDSVPKQDTSGVYLEGGISAILDFQTRENVQFRTTYFRIVDVDDTATYSAIVDENTVSYLASSGDTANDIAAGLRDAINNDATVSGIVTADLYDLNEDGTKQTVRLQGDSISYYTLDKSVGGTGSADLSGDPILYDALVFVKPDDPKSKRDNRIAWKKLDGGLLEDIGFRGMTKRFPVGGYDRLAVQVFDRSPAADNVPVRPEVQVGPGLLE
ncbi:MAG: hypothetical protein ABEN55_12085 [Bradymonadaceae bacterium]